ncbi:MAG: hypothetical protein AB1324_01785 [Candidatus Micrarchaeota archaeon]
MTVTAKEMRRYARDMLRRKTFRFHRLNGILEPRQHSLLHLADAFAKSHEDQPRFLLALRDSPPEVRDRINREFGKNGAKPASRREALERWKSLIRNIQGHIISEGVYTDFGRPASVGLLLEKRALDGISLYFSLGESHEGVSLRPGRVYYEPDGRTVVLFYLWDALARTAELLDLLVSVRDLGEEGNFERTLYRARKEDLSAWCERAAASSPDMNPEFYILTLAMRSALSGLRAAMERAESPREALRAAINMQLDSLVAHEVSHLVERKANGHLPFDKAEAEITGYLLQAVHSRADLALISMMNRQFDFAQGMPALVGDVRSRGPMILLEGEVYLRAYASETLESRFLALCGRRSEEVLDISKIKSSQTSDYIRPEHMPLVEKAMCNPSLTG